MTAEERTKLDETLVKVFKLTPEQLATLYNEAGDLIDLKAVTEADEKRVAKFTTEKTQQLNRGIKEGAEKIEKAIKEKYSVESELIGIELVDSIVVRQVEDATKAGSKDITKHADYIKLEASIDKKLKDRDKEWEGKLALKESEFKKEKLFEKVKDRALPSLDARKPILPNDPEKAQYWRTAYINELKSTNYQESDDGTPIVLDKDGNALKDSHGNPITFDEFIKMKQDRMFEFPVAEGRSSPGNKPPDGKPGQGTGGYKTKADCLTKLKDPKITAEERKTVTELMDNLKE
jgi:hypothetical protein